MIGIRLRTLEFCDDILHEHGVHLFFQFIYQQHTAAAQDLFHIWSKGHQPACTVRLIGQLQRIETFFTSSIDSLVIRRSPDLSHPQFLL